MGRDIQALSQNGSVLACLVEHIDEVRIFQDVGNLRTAKQVFYVLGDAGRNTAPFTESLPDFNGIGCCL